MESMNVGMCPFWIGGLGVDIICVPWNCGYWAPVDLEQGFLSNSVLDFVHHTGRGKRSPGLRVFQLELSHRAGELAAGLRSRRTRRDDYFVALFPMWILVVKMGVLHHRCILWHWSHKRDKTTLVAVCTAGGHRASL